MCVRLCVCERMCVRLRVCVELTAGSVDLHRLLADQRQGALLTHTLLTTEGHFVPYREGLPRRNNTHTHTHRLGRKVDVSVLDAVCSCECVCVCVHAPPPSSAPTPEMLEGAVPGRPPWLL